MIESIFTILIVLLTVVMTRRDWRWGLIFLVAALPLNNRLMFDSGISPQLLPVRVVLLSVFIALAWDLFRQVLAERLNWIKKDPFLFLLLILGLVRLLSLYRPIDMRASLPFLFFYSSMIGLYLVLKLVIQRYGSQFVFQLYQFHAWVAFATSLFSLIQLWAFKGFGRVLPGVWPSTDEPTRFGATFWDINHYAPYIGSVIPYFLMQTIYEERRSRRLLYLLGFIVTNLGMGMTLSRSGWVGYAFGLMVLGLLLLYRKLKKALFWYITAMVTMLALSVIGILYFNLPIAKRLYSLTPRVYNESFDAHQILNKGHFEIFSKFPVIGGGFGSFNDRFRESSFSHAYFAIDPVSNVRLPSHSVWLEVLSETGLVGMAVFISLLGWVLVGLLRATSTTDRRVQLLAVALLSSLAGMLCSGFFYHYNLEYFWMIIFMAVFVVRTQQTEEKLDVMNYLIVFFLVGLGTAIIFPFLGENALIDWDESIYAQVAQNIMRFRDPITLRWQMEKFWFEKPPLYFWLTAFLYLIHEVSEFSARFWSALSGVLGIVVVYFFGRDMFNKRVGLASALTLLATVHWLFQSRNGTLDVMMATLILTTLWFFYRARTRPSDWLWVGVFAGLALMTKGAVVVVPLSVMVLIGLIDIRFYNGRGNYPWRYLMKRVGLPFLLVVLPWHLASLALHGRKFIDSYLIYHVLLRSTAGIEQHGNPFFWYVTVLKVWARHNFVLLLGSLGLISFLGLNDMKNRRKPDLKLVFLVIWFLLTFLIFSASASKIQWYIMPIYPVMSLLIGYALVTLAERINFRLPYLLLLVLIVAVPFFKERYQKMWDLPDAWRGVAKVVPQVKYEARKVKDPRLLIVDLSPGPAMFYSPFPTDTGNWQTLVNKAESEGSFFAVGRIGQAEDLIKMYPQSQVKIYKQYDDFALFGRW